MAYRKWAPPTLMNLNDVIRGEGECAVGTSPTSGGDCVSGFVAAAGACTAGTAALGACSTGGTPDTPP